MMKIFEKFQDYIKKSDKKRLIENLIFVTVIGFVLMMTANILFDNKGGRKAKEEDGNVNTVSTALSYEQQLEQNLIRILGGIEGVEKVDVMITLESDSEAVPAMDIVESEKTTNEKDNNGGTREIIQHDINKKVVMVSQAGTNEPLIIKNIKPEIKGVVVLVKGINDENIKYDIFKTVQTVLGVPAYKVKIVYNGK